MVIVDEAPFTPGAMLDAFGGQEGVNGAVVSFTGLCRGGPGDTQAKGLYLDAYPPFTRDAIARMEIEARARFAVTDVLIRHRHGEIGAGEAIVFVAVASRHRRAAFDAADYLMDQLKTRAPLWKKERRVSGDVWIEPTDDDQARAKAWHARGTKA